MAHAISRIYATKADADAAIEDLEAHRFQPEEIFVVRPPERPLAALASDSRAVVEQIADTIAKGCILKRDADVYAKHVARGAVFVTVYAAFGAGRKATVILDRHDPVDPGIQAPIRPRARYDEATPLSSAFYLPLLSSQAAPVGAVLGLPSVLLADGPVLSAWRRYSTVFYAPAPLSHLLGLPVMTANGGTTSSGLGLPTVTARGATTSSSLGLPTLTSNGKPTSSSIGLPTLTARGKPTNLGLPLLW